MKLLIALAAGLLATGAASQTTTTVTTRTTPSHERTTVRTVESTHVSERNVPRYRNKRVCSVKWRNHRKIRTCRTVRTRRY